MAIWFRFIKQKLLVITHTSIIQKPIEAKFTTVTYTSKFLKYGYLSQVHKTKVVGYNPYINNSKTNWNKIYYCNLH